jgi:hypothetical protein
MHTVFLLFTLTVWLIAHLLTVVGCNDGVKQIKGAFNFWQCLSANMKVDHRRG